METAVFVALIAAMVTAVGWPATYIAGVQLQARKDRLDLINRRLTELYGPLYIYCKTAGTVYRELLNKLNRPQGIFSDKNIPVTEAEAREWFHWMKHILGPMNEQCLRAISEKSYLIVEDDIHPSILAFSAHVVGYRVILAKWESGDFGEQYPHLEFPSELDVYAKESFSKLKLEQRKMMEMRTWQWLR